MLIWKTNTSSVRTASYRYRCLFPTRHMAQLGYPSIIYEPPEEVYCSPRADALVFMKSFTNADLSTCKAAVEKGIPVVIDLCDNIFIDDYAEGKTLDYIPRDNFQAMAQLATAVVTTGPALKQTIQDQIGASPPVWVIPDGCETLDDMEYALAMGYWQRWLTMLRYSPQGARRLLAAHTASFLKHFPGRLKVRAPQLPPLRLPPFQLRRVKPMVKQRVSLLLKAGASPVFPRGTQAPAPLVSSPRLGVPQAVAAAPALKPDLKTVLWFGNHGSSYGQAGMVNVLEVGPVLQQLHPHIPLKLRIVSNNPRKYADLIEPLPFPTDYVEWHPLGIYDEIAASDVVVIPNSKSPFSLCKSANRAILALSLGVPVVATATPALLPFQDCIIFDDWDGGLRRYLSQPELVQNHVQRAQAMIAATYSGPAIARQWIDLINWIQQARHG